MAAAIVASHTLLRADVVEGDSMVYQYWMRRWSDPALFGDGLTRRLQDSERYPQGYVWLFHLASHVVDPVWFGKGLGMALMALAGFMVFLIVRHHSAWRPAAWLGAALFLALDGHRFYGGFPRAFVHVMVLATVLALLHRRRWALVLLPAVSVLLYPPATLLVIGVLALGVTRWERRPRLDPGTAPAAAGGIALGIATLAITQLGAGSPLDVLTAARARQYPEFGSHGDLHYFGVSPVVYLRQNRSGFDLRNTGAVLVVATLALLAARPANLRLLTRPVLVVPVVSLGAYALAQLLLFRLYLPHRFTYPLVAFMCVLCAVALRPTWEALWGRRRAVLLGGLALAAPGLAFLLGTRAFPLAPHPALHRLVTPAALAATAMALVGGPLLALALRRLPAARAVTAGAALTGLALLAMLLAAPHREVPGRLCARSGAVAYLATLPKNAVIAGDPADLTCLTVSARRAVVISTQLAFSYEAGYLREARRRMFATLRAYYGPSLGGILALRRYGVTDLWVRGGSIAREQAGHGRWGHRHAPYGAYVQHLLASGRPASLRLPVRCRRWSLGRAAVYDVPCLARRRPS